MPNSGRSSQFISANDVPIGSSRRYQLINLGCPLVRRGRGRLSKGEILFAFGRTAGCAAGPAYFFPYFFHVGQKDCYPDRVTAAAASPPVRHVVRWTRLQSLGCTFFPEKDDSSLQYCLFVRGRFHRPWFVVLRRVGGRGISGDQNPLQRRIMCVMNG